MKKLFYCTLFLLMWFIFSNFQCDEDVFVSGRWYISNETDEALVVNIVGAKDSKEIFLQSGQRKELVRLYYYDNPVFDDIYSAIWSDSLSWDNHKVEVKSENNEVLKTWTYAQREDEGRQFFSGEDWLHSTTPGSLAWEFPILPEDLIQ